MTILTRLIIYETEDGHRTVFDIIEFEGNLNIVEVLRKLPSVPRRGSTMADSRRMWKLLIDELGTPSFPILLEKFER